MGLKVSRLDPYHPYSLVDHKGRRFFLERTYRAATFKTGSFEVVMENTGNLATVFRLKTDIGNYFPMNMVIEPAFKYSALERTVGNTWRHVCMLVDEYREFIQHMEEVAE